MESIWILEKRLREQKNGKWSEWVAFAMDIYYTERPRGLERQLDYAEFRAVEYVRKDAQ